MVGHTGSIPAASRRSRRPTAASAEVVDAVASAGGVALVTADHGNAEKMLAEDGVSPHTAHTTNPVPLVLTAPALRLRDGGELSDLAPTCLALLGHSAAAGDDRPQPAR